MEKQGETRPQNGDLVRFAPFEEIAQVFCYEQTGENIRLGLIFLQSKRAETFFLSAAELAQRVMLIYVFANWKKAVTS